MSEMVEKVARAIWEQTPVWSKGNGENAWKLFIDQARAAIEAMIEPGDIMKSAEDALDNALCHDVEAYGGSYEDSRKSAIKDIAGAILAERNRCISIAQSIDPHNEAEAHLIETIVRRMRGEV